MLVHFFYVADDEVICLEPKKKEEKQPAGRPRKYHKLENCELDINELHDFNDILKVDQWYSEHYVKFYQEIATTTNTRKRFSTCKKEEIRNYYVPCGNNREAARAFKLQDSAVRNICKAGPPEISKHGGFKGGKAWKGNAKGARRPL